MPNRLSATMARGQLCGQIGRDGGSGGSHFRARTALAPLRATAVNNSQPTARRSRGLVRQCRLWFHCLHAFGDLPPNCSGIIVSIADKIAHTFLRASLCAATVLGY